MRGLRAAAAAVLAALVSAGCMLPPFDAGLSLAYRSASRMTLVCESGPVYFWQGHASAREFYFLPSQVDFTTTPVIAAAGHGLLVAADDYKVRVWYLDLDAAGNAGIWGERTFVIDSSSPQLYKRQIQMLKAAPGSTDYILLHDWAGSDATRSGLTGLKYERFFYDLPETVASVSWVALGMGSPGSLLGLSFLPLEDPAWDQMAFLMYDAVAGVYREYVHSVSGPLASSPLSDRAVLLPGPPPAASAFYQHDESSGRSVVSWNAGSGWVTYAWDAASVLDPVLLPVSERIDALLSSGELYHRGDQTDTVYGWDGRKKYQFPVGSMRLAGERYVGGVPTLFYTLAFWERGDGDDDRMYVRVYTLPTVDLGKLD